MRIVLGVTGGISAYKACDIISGLKATGNEVKVIMTESAKRFVTEEVLAVTSGHQVFTDANRDMDGTISHIDLSHWGDILVIAPATANTINKIRFGFADNFLTTVVMAWDKMGFIAPAMNPKMYHKTRESIGILKQYPNWNIIDPVEGKMACGDVGMGKLEKPRKIVDQINVTLDNTKV
jgi:phosphopantothenoylcysteine decarboxylase/phosphopantothenate--cysteine ligase